MKMKPLPIVYEAETRQLETSSRNHPKNSSAAHHYGRFKSVFVLVLVFLIWRHFIDQEVVDSLRHAMRSWETTRVMTSSTIQLKGTLPPSKNNRNHHENASTNNPSPSSKEDFVAAATGQKFEGKPMRTYVGPIQFSSSSSSSNNHIRTRQKEPDDDTEREQAPQILLDGYLSRKIPGPLACQKWAVVTTIYEPTPAVRRVGNQLAPSGWCMVIVADAQTPKWYMRYAGWKSKNKANQQQNNNTTISTKPILSTRGDNVVFLSVKDQLELAKMVPFVDQLPFESFARKNVGYLYAIWRGAQIIFDLDDDNLLRMDKNDDDDMNNNNTNLLLSGLELLETYSNFITAPDDSSSNTTSGWLVRHVSISDHYKGRAFNPFPMMGSSVPDAWPRGLPIPLIRDKRSKGQAGPMMLKELPTKNIAVVQSTCNHDPDVDVIYRLTRELPFSFDASAEKAMTLQVPPQLYAPYNAQSTLHYPSAFWGLYLPMTVTGRVSDVWRAYIVQRLLKELEQDAHVLYSPPLVTHQRKELDYAGDFAAESHLYLRTEALLEFLEEWKPTTPGPLTAGAADTLQAPIEDLWIRLYERGYVEMKDVQGVQGWLKALTQGGYVFPAVKKHQREAPDVSTGGVEARKECARRRLAEWQEPVPTMMNGSNYGALAFQNTKMTVARLLAEYELEHPFPHSIDLICRASGIRSGFELAILVESIELYLPKCAGRVLLVLDREDVEFARENIPPWVDVMFSEFAYNMPGRLGNQLFNMYSDQQGRSEYVAVIDSDTALVTPVTPDLIFNLNKTDEEGNAPPYILTDTQWQKGDWSKGDDWMFKGDSYDWNFMITLPQVFPRAMFPRYRAHVEAIHNYEFETTDLWQHFRTTVKLGWMGMSQFCLLGNYFVRYWTRTSFDLRNETDSPAIRYGMHLPYHGGLTFRPGGRKDPSSFMNTGREQIREGICEMFCSVPLSADPKSWHPPTLKDCASLCPAALKETRSVVSQRYFKYNKNLYGTPEQQQDVYMAHFRPFKAALAEKLAR